MRMGNVCQPRRRALRRFKLERWLKAREDGSLGRHGDALAALDPTDAYVVEEIGHNARGGRMS